jgi:hypothetical protein
MSFVRIQKKSEDCRAYPTTASTLYTIGGAVYPDASTGNLVVGVTGSRVLGIALQGKTTADATTGPILVDIAHADDVFEAGVTTGTMAQTYVGDTCDFYSTTGLTLDLTADTNHDVVIVGWDGTTTSKAYVRFNKTVFA